MHGCIRKKTVLELFQKKYGDERTKEVEQLLNGGSNSQGVKIGEYLIIISCFRLFDIVHSVIETGEQLRRITREMIETSLQMESFMSKSGQHRGNSQRASF